LSFDGTGNFLTIPDADSLDWGNSVSFFFVCNFDGSQSAGLRTVLTKGSSGRVAWIPVGNQLLLDRPLPLPVTLIIDSNTGLPVDNTVQLTVTKAASTGRLRVNAISQISTSDFAPVLSDNIEPIQIAGFPIGPSGVLEATFSAVLIYNRELTNSEVGQVENYLFKRYPLFFPTDLSGLVLWLDGADVGSVTQTDGRVTQWDDKSGNNNDAVATGTERPSYIAETSRAIPSLSFDGGDDLLTITDAASLDWGNTVSFFVVFNVTGSSTTEEFFNKGSGGRMRRINTEARLQNPGNLVITSNSPAFSINTNSILTVTQGALGIDQRLRINGTDEFLFGFTIFPLSDNTDDLIIGNNVGGTAGLTGKISEVIMYDRVLTISEIDQVEAALAIKYGITI